MIEHMTKHNKRDAITGLNIILRNDVTSGKVNFRPDIRQNYFGEKIKT